MAKKKRGRPKKKQVTYDSQEIKFILGVVAMGVGVISLMSYVINEEQSLFNFVRMLFGDATIFLAIFMINLALMLFGLRYVLNKPASLFAQLAITFLSSIIIAATANPLFRRQFSYEGGLGGIIGYEAAAFSQNNILLNFTAPVAVMLIILLLPYLTGQTMNEFFGMVFGKLAQFVKFMTTSQPRQSEEEEAPQEAVPAGSNPSMFSHFRNATGGKKEEAKQASAEKKNEQKEPKAPEFAGMNKGQQQKASEDGADEDGPSVVVKSSSELAAEGEPQLRYPKWKLPPLNLLDPIPDLNIPEEDVKHNSTIIEQTLASFGIESKVMSAQVGPSVTQYALDIALGTKVNKISNLKNDLALALATSANSVRIEVPIPGTSYVGIEVPNQQRKPVFFRELIEDTEFKGTELPLPVTVGRDIAGKAVVTNIQKMPHLLIAGATGSGKSVLTNSFITSLLMSRTPDEVKFILVDPKQVELSDYNDIPHLLTPVIVEMEKVVNALKWAVDEMERRYTLFRESRVRNLEGYNEKMGFSALPYIVIVIDEMADMMLTAERAEAENAIVRLAQKARATGIHLVLATQRPSVNVITGVIKANIPGRIGMSVTTQTDSRVILDHGGAEALLGKGDLLFRQPDKPKSYRVQGVFVSQEEIQRVVKFIKEQTDQVEYIDGITVDKEAAEQAANAAGSPSGDDLFSDAVRVIVSEQKGSASMLQRKMSVGYNRAAKLIDEMHEFGIVGPAKGSKPRDVLITDAEGFLEKLNS